jgi:sortase A
MRISSPASSDESTAPRRRAHRPDRGWRWLNVAAAVMVTGGLLMVGSTGFNWWSRIQRVEASQVELARTADDGQSGGVARLHIPRLALDLVVVEGSGEAELLRGPGHIPGTPLFGHPGNVGVAGHRYPGIFWDLDRLRDGDPVVVETREVWYVYRVSRELIVGPSDVDVLAPHPAGAPEGARDFLTLVTCDPVLTTLRRLIRQAVLVRATSRAAGAPPELIAN